MGISVIAVSTLICFILINMTPEFAIKFKSMKSAVVENPNSKTTESSASRILIWKSSLELIMNKPIIGYGSGDVKDLLIYKYLQNGYFGIAEKKLNAHNQFLQTQLASGIFGLLMLLFIFIQFLINSLKNGKLDVLSFSKPIKDETKKGDHKQKKSFYKKKGGGKKHNPKNPKNTKN